MNCISLQAKPRTTAVTRDEAEQALNAVVKPNALTWVVVGDLRQIKKPMRALNLG